MEDSQSDSESLNVNQRLDFSDLSSDEMEEDTKSDGATKSADNSASRRYLLESVQRTKLDFDFVDGLDYHCDYEEEWEDEVEGHEQNLSQTNLMEVPTNKRIRFCLNTSGASGDGLALPTTTNSTALPSTSNAALTTAQNVALPATPSSVAIPNAAIPSTSNAALASTPNSVALPATPNSEFPSTPNSESESGLSPCRTRSGRVRIEAWSSVEKQMRMQAANGKSLCSNPREILPKESEPKTPSRLPTPTFNLPKAKELNLLQINLPNLLQICQNLASPKKILPKPEEPPSPVRRSPSCKPPQLHYNKRPKSRIQPRLLGYEGPASDPIMPPTNEMKSIRLFDDSRDSTQLITSPVSTSSAPRPLMRSRIFSDSFDPETRRLSAPAPVQRYAASNQEQAIINDQLRKRKRSSNINPFTPTSIMATLRKKARMTSGESATESNNGSFESSLTLDMQNLAAAAANDLIDDETIEASGPTKRLKVSDINISRYEEEFLKIREIASGTFGTVSVARHRLDGMVYAIKITRNKIHGNTHEEKVAMNEVFAHSALIKHKHVVRYYNSWVENGRVYIQNEYCEGGSLAAKIQEFRMTGKRFTEAELKRILLHLAKGLDYIHSKLLVHLDVKPENIFISVDYPMRISEHSSNQTSPINDIENSNPAKVISPNTENIMNKKEATSTEEEIFSGNESTDSGHHSGTAKKCVKTDSNSSSPIDDRVSYKIGDLGHVAPIHGDSIPEEGDCRYMAPELLEHDINRELLTKADIFSLGLTLFEAASLRELPKNSLEDVEYEKLKSGQLPYLDGYSKDFNNLLKSMVNPDAFTRPSATKLASLQSLRGTNSSNNKSRSRLYQELKDTKAKLRLLEQQLGTSASDTPKSSGAAPKSRILVGRGCAKSRSSNVISTTTTPSKW